MLSRCKGVAMVTIKEFFDLVMGFPNAELYMSAKSNESKVENAVKVEQVIVDYDERTDETRVIVG